MTKHVPRLVGASPAVVQHETLDSTQHNNTTTTTTTQHQIASQEMETPSLADPDSLPHVLPYCNILPTPPSTEAACAAPLFQQPTTFSSTDLATISAKLEVVNISEHPNTLLQPDTLPQPGHRPVPYSGDVPAAVSKQFLAVSTDLSERFFNHRLLDVIYELFYEPERGPRESKQLKRLLQDIEDRYLAIVKDLTHAWEKEKTNLTHAWEKEKSAWEKEKTDLETQLKLQNINAQHDKDLHQAEKETLEIRCQSAEKRTLDIEQSFTRYRAASNQDKLNPRGGSVSRAQCWERGSFSLRAQPTLRKSNELSSDEVGSLQKTFQHLLSDPKTPEKECYGPIQDAVSIFVPNIKCHITAKNFYLAGEAPDISICLMRSITAHSHLCYGIIEVKRPEEVLDTASHLGQVKDYILSLLKAQTSRNRFWGILTNVKENILIEIRRNKTPGNLPHKIIKYAPMEWAAVMNYLRDATSIVDLCPPPLHFAKELGDVENIISGSEKWALGEFAIPHEVKKKMVVKCSKSSPPNAYHKLELKILRHLAACNKLNSAPPSIVKLVWDPAIRAGDDCYEISDEDSDPPLPRIQFGIAPAGRRFELAAFRTPAQFQNAIDTLLDGLNWLHNTAQVIHRDIRPANVIIDWQTKQAVIIDFDCAYQLQDGNQGDAQKVQLTTYGGGLICLPTEVLNLALEELKRGKKRVLNDIWYEPQAVHDLVAFVLFVLATLFPVQFNQFPAHKLQDSESGEEIQGLLDLHSNLAASSIWGVIWRGALQGDMEELRRIGHLGWWPTLGTAVTKPNAHPGSIKSTVSFDI
ncbi:hypothetical protein L211DRAFT_849586 [Terfezia boudieri ATCC MYA-4762]|uniref:EKC/KEOPS complex subunit BUD32 n=1 Tax=Terfezia boudieri ATCC MYA-4762 TaxID=1051890 RepID=A0A3N4LZX3_9PEZI|nr:hypothetical protein L211DRAFT_849586 [Terfezia boudieri ATCC MYA-4762]